MLTLSGNRIASTRSQQPPGATTLGSRISLDDGLGAPPPERRNRRRRGVAAAAPSPAPAWSEAIDDAMDPEIAAALAGLAADDRSVAPTPFPSTPSPAPSDGAGDLAALQELFSARDADIGLFDKDLEECDEILAKSSVLAGSASGSASTPHSAVSRTGGAASAFSAADDGDAAATEEANGAAAVAKVPASVPAYDAQAISFEEDFDEALMLALKKQEKRRDGLGVESAGAEAKREERKEQQRALRGAERAEMARQQEELEATLAAQAHEHEVAMAEQEIEHMAQQQRHEEAAVQERARIAELARLALENARLAEERQLAAAAAEAKHLAKEQRLAAEAEANRLAAEAKRRAEAVEAARLAAEAEAVRLVDERLVALDAERRATEEKRLAAEAEVKRLAAEAEANRLAEQQRVAAEVEAKRLTVEAERARIAEERQLAAEAVRLADVRRLAEVAEAKRLAEGQQLAAEAAAKRQAAAAEARARRAEEQRRLTEARELAAIQAAEAEAARQLRFDAEAREAEIRREQFMVMNYAASTIQIVWRQYREQQLLDLVFEPAATMIQACWRGYWLRKRIGIVKNAAHFVDDDDFDYAEIDLSEFDLDHGQDDLFNAAPPAAPAAVVDAPCFDPRATGFSPVRRGVPAIPPRTAWDNSPDGTVEAPSPIFGRPGSKMTNQTPRAPSVAGVREVKIRKEWGFKDPKTASAMLKRAKRLGRKRKPKKPYTSPPKPTSGDLGNVAANASPPKLGYQWGSESRVVHKNMAQQLQSATPVLPKITTPSRPQRGDTGFGQTTARFHDGRSGSAKPRLPKSNPLVLPDIKGRLL